MHMQASASPCLCSRLRRAGRAVTRAYDRAFEPFGLTVSQFAILRNAGRMDGPTVSALAEATGHERSGLWRSLQPLVREGLLTLSPGADQRTRRVEVTAKGQALAEAATPAWADMQRQLGGALGDARRSELLALLEELEALVD